MGVWCRSVGVWEWECGSVGVVGLTPGRESTMLHGGLCTVFGRLYIHKCPREFMNI